MQKRSCLFDEVIIEMGCPENRDAPSLGKKTGQSRKRWKRLHCDFERILAHFSLPLSFLASLDLGTRGIEAF
jgi:hypothetical protein